MLMILRERRISTAYGSDLNNRFQNERSPT
jgi:hypothetical protein